MVLPFGPFDRPQGRLEESKDDLAQGFKGTKGVVLDKEKMKKVNIDILQFLGYNSTRG